MPDKPSSRASSRGHLLFYKFARAVVVWVCTRPWRVRVVGAERVPASGGFVFAPSHRSMLDIPWVAAATKRRIRFMGKASLFRVPVLGLVLYRARRLPSGARRQRPRPAPRIARDPDERRTACGVPRGHAPARHGDSAAAIWAPRISPSKPASRSCPSQSPAAKNRFAAVTAYPASRPVWCSWASRSNRRRASARSCKRDLVDQLSAQVRVELQKLFDEAYVIRDRHNN